MSGMLRLQSFADSSNETFRGSLKAEWYMRPIINCVVINIRFYFIINLSFSFEFGIKFGIN